MKRVRVKICGITRLEDALNAVELGADALGFVFCPKSPRNISAKEAQKIIQQLPAFVSVVGLFMDASSCFVNDILKTAQLDILQFHGQESPAFCNQFSKPYIKAIPMNEAMDVQAYCRMFSDSRGFLLDSTRFGLIGGTGETFDWDQIPDLDKPIIMAGGIRAGNVRRAIAQSQCYGIDLSSGVEVAPGKKDAFKMAQLFEAIQTPS